MRRIATLAGMLLLATHFAQAGCAAMPAQLPFEATPSPQQDPNWQARLAALDTILATTDLSKIHVVFLGDSITEAWAPPVFDHFNQYRGALNLGVRGDGAHSMLWRLPRIPFGTKLKPDLIVLLIGTNNLWPQANLTNVATGIGAVVGELRRRSPTSKILMLKLLPRGEQPNDSWRLQVDQVNKMLSACAEPGVTVIDPGPVLLDGKGVLAKDISFDTLHLTWLGYAILGGALEMPIRNALSN